MGGSGHWSLPDAGGGFSRHFAVWGDDFGRHVLRAFPDGGDRFFLFVGNSDPLGGVRAELLPSTQGHGCAGTGGVDAFGAGLGRIGGHGLFRGEVVDRLRADKHLDSICVVSNRNGFGLVVDGEVGVESRQR